MYKHISILYLDDVTPHIIPKIIYIYIWWNQDFSFEKAIYNFFFNVFKMHCIACCTKTEIFSRFRLYIYFFIHSQTKYIFTILFKNVRLNCKIARPNTP